MSYPAEEIAAYDQELARALHCLDRTIKALQIGAAEVGEVDALASILVTITDRPELIGVSGESLLIAALHRLAFATEVRP